jgi:hypothetical protein
MNDDHQFCLNFLLKLSDIVTGSQYIREIKRNITELKKGKR